MLSLSQRELSCLSGYMGLIGGMGTQLCLPNKYLKVSRIDLRPAARSVDADVLAPLRGPAVVPATTGVNSLSNGRCLIAAE
jgi:hypothetical protein